MRPASRARSSPSSSRRASSTTSTTPTTRRSTRRRSTTRPTTRPSRPTARSHYPNRGSDCSGPIHFVTGDAINGPLHSEDTLAICGYADVRAHRRTTTRSRPPAHSAEGQHGCASTPDGQHAGGTINTTRAVADAAADQRAAAQHRPGRRLRLHRRDDDRAQRQHDDGHERRHDQRRGHPTDRVALAEQRRRLRLDRERRLPRHLHAVHRQRRLHRRHQLRQRLRQRQLLAAR